MPYLDSQIDTLLNHISRFELEKSHCDLELRLIKALGGGFKEENIKND